MGVTISKNYQSVRLDLGEESDVFPDETSDQARERIAVPLLKSLQEEAKEMKVLMGHLTR